MAPLIAPVVNTVLEVIGKLIPDKQKAAEMQLEATRMILENEGRVLAADQAVASGQIDVNRQEAALESLFVSGWRPAIRWVCAAAFAGQFIVTPLTQYAFVLMGQPAPPMPQMDWENLMPILLGILGLGGFRTYEKIKLSKGA